MHPILLKLGSITVYSWGFMLSLAFVSSTTLMYLITKKKNPSYIPYILDGIIYVVIAAIIGSRLFYILEHLDYYSRHLLEIVMVQNGGLNFAGGLIGAILAILIYSHINKLGLLELFDICTAPTFLGMAIGRVGCFLNGCCYGIPTKLPWGIKFPDTLIPVHPTQIYDLIMNLIFMSYIIITYNTKKYHGHVILKGVLIYSIHRFFLEFIRTNPKYFLNLSQAQYISIIAFIFSSFILFKKRKLLKNIK